MLEGGGVVCSGLLFCSCPGETEKKQGPRCTPSTHRIQNKHLQSVFCVEPKERQSSVIYCSIPLGMVSVDITLPSDHLSGISS